MNANTASSSTPPATIYDAALETDNNIYPSSDGQPVANNTKHLELITTTKSGLEKQYFDRDDVFVAADLFWYPVKGNPKIAVAPDVMVAFGRPPGHRSSYKQWQEDNTPFHVVFEFLSESNTPDEMTRKALFFDRYGVEEYYLYSIDFGTLTGFVRYGGELQPIEPDLKGWSSPRLGISFEVVWSGGKEGFGTPDLLIYYADGSRFLTFVELEQERMKSEAGRVKAEAERMKAEAERVKAEAERDSALTALAAERERIKQLEERLRALGLAP